MESMRALKRRLYDVVYKHMVRDADSLTIVGVGDRADRWVGQLSASTVDGPNAAAVTVVSFSTVFTLLLTVVAALGVFNAVLLTTRERRRDLGMLKSIGMTPRQVVTMTVTSVATLGAQRWPALRRHGQ
jgi:ABC-type antimicrobial peptide transport system permease subunit